MAWQDELKNLDDDLSAGRITSDDHRRRRDEILAAASSNPAGIRRARRQQATSIANAFHTDPKLAGATASAPPANQSAAPGSSTAQHQLTTAPAAMPPTSGQAETGTHDNNGNPGWEAQLPGQGGPQPASVPNAAQLYPPQYQPNQVPQPNESPIGKQGSEVFRSAGPGVPRWILLVGALVMVVVIVVVAWTLDLPWEGDEQTAAPPQQRPELSIDRLPNPTDRALSTSGVLTVDQAQLENVIKPDQAAYLSKAGTEKIYYRAVNARNVGYQLFAFQTEGATDARNLASEVVKSGKQLGMADVSIDGVPPGVTITKASNATAMIFEAVYTADSTVVRIVVGQPDQADEQLITAALKHSILVTAESIRPN
jgi:hypothetical protein